MKTGERYPFSEPCPYRPGNRSSGEFVIGAAHYSRYEELLASGWRRSGPVLYRYRCEGCAACVPIRLRADRLALGKRARRLERLNADLSLALVPPAFSDERFNLYSAYVRGRHGGQDGLEESFGALIAAPMAVLSEYRDAGGKLLALGFIDALPKGLSSVYFAFDPAASGRSLGTHSVYAESAAGLALGKPYYYIGFWVPDAPSMDYKAGFHPFELALGGEKLGQCAAENAEAASFPAATPAWREFANKEEAKLALSELARR
ncbi:arginyltransferase [bacterium]|nr:arginyltransferase [bacterium]